MFFGLPPEQYHKWNARLLHSRVTVVDRRLVCEVLYARFDQFAFTTCGESLTAKSSLPPAPTSVCFRPRSSVTLEANLPQVVRILNSLPRSFFL